MDTSTQTIISSKSTMRALRILARTELPLSIAQIARHTGLTRPSVTNALERLDDAGIILTTRSGNARLFQLVKENIYVEKILLPLFDLEDNLVHYMTKDIKDALGQKAVSIIMFGSFARGDYTAESDVDILVVSPDTLGYKNLKGPLESELAQYSSDFYRKFGYPLEVLTYDYKDATELQTRAPALYKEILDDGILIAGTSDWINDA